jgi:hypothetical protein
MTFGVRVLGFNCKRERLDHLQVQIFYEAFVICIYLDKAHVCLSQTNYILISEANARNRLSVDHGTVPAIEVFYVEEIVNAMNAGMFFGDIFVAYL